VRARKTEIRETKPTGGQTEEVHARPQRATHRVGKKKKRSRTQFLSYVRQGSVSDQRKKKGEKNNEFTRHL